MSTAMVHVSSSSIASSSQQVTAESIGVQPAANPMAQLRLSDESSYVQEAMDKPVNADSAPQQGVDESHAIDLLAAATTHFAADETLIEQLLTKKLLEILTEMAVTGECNWLPWSTPEDATRQNHAGARNINQVMAEHMPSPLPRCKSSPTTESLDDDGRSQEYARQTNGELIRSRKRPRGPAHAIDAGNELAATGSYAFQFNNSCISSSTVIKDREFDMNEQNVSESTALFTQADQGIDNYHFPGKDRPYKTPKNSMEPFTTMPFSSLLREELDFTSLQSCTCQKEVIYIALSVVLDHFYQHQGYKASPTEMRLYYEQPLASANQQTQERMATVEPVDLVSLRSADSSELFGTVRGSQQPSGDTVEKHLYMQRRERLLNMLGPLNGPSAQTSAPFTLQRIAEVLLAPKRYYTQTHKLCNSLEKLLLVTTSESEFGGSTGGVCERSIQGGLESAALAEEQGRLIYEVRRQRLRRRAPSYLDAANDASLSGDYTLNEESHDDVTHGELLHDRESARGNFLEAAARASLRTKFDHVGVDAQSSAAAGRAIAETRGVSGSPPPPNCSVVAGLAHVPLLRPGGDSDHLLSLGHVSSPILFNHHGSSQSNVLPLQGTIHPNASLQLLQLHHAAALAGVSPFELLNLNVESHSLGAAPTLSSLATVAFGKDIDVESRSSCSSDIASDSESDVSFDDSASDRSDGSDSGHSEPISAARAVALSRMQQQQRLQQSRMLNAYNLNNGPSSPAHHGESYRTDLDTDVQSREGEGRNIRSPPADEFAGL
ncbi:hypothetical protein MPSEU_000369600 [Mayamaea pseudoterrestris]|nr:hypothetical protein MPSEU_000369600 [Mayamaea pseudoterrestris]